MVIDTAKQALALQIGNNRWVNEVAAAKHLGYTTPNFSRMVIGGRVPAYIVGTQYRCNLAQLDAWKAEEKYIPQYLEDSTGEEQFIGEEEACAYLGATLRNLRSWCDNHGCPVHEQGTGVYLYKCSELDAWILSGRSDLQEKSSYVEYIMQDPWITRKQVANYAGVTNQTVYAWQRFKGLTGHVVKGQTEKGLTLIKKSEFEEWYYQYCGKRLRGNGMKIITDEIVPHALSVRQAAAYLGVTEWAINKWIHTADLPAEKIGRRWTFDVTELDKWVETK